MRLAARPLARVLVAACASLVAACSSESGGGAPAAKDGGTRADGAGNGNGNGDLGGSVGDAANGSDDLAATVAAGADLSSESVRDLAAGPGPARDFAAPSNPLIVARPYKSHVPKSYDPTRPTPLVVMLHGYASDGQTHEDTFFKLTAISDEKTFLYAYPDGTKDTITLRFWNATDACCNLFGSKVDDVAYLTAVLDDMSARYNVDPKQVYLVGHSNGGFMSHRMACDVSKRVAAIVAFAGDDWKDTTKCVPSEPVAILQVHGDADPTIQYNGGQNGLLAPYPSAHDSVFGWAQKFGCGATPDETAPAVNVVDDGTLPGDETTKAVYTGCPAGAAELWTMHGAVHQPPLSTMTPDLIWGFLSAHPKP